MEHLHTLTISIFLAGIISFFLPASEKNSSSSQKVTTVTTNHSTISAEVIVSWLDSSNLDSNSLGNDLPIIVVNKLVVLDLPKSNNISSHANEDRIVLISPKYWEIVHSIESKQGEMLYRPRNKEKSCVKTSSPCGHYQISAQALEDIGCTSAQCKMDRENPETSLTMSKKLEQKNLQRLAKKGYSHLPDYQKYLIHQQGATGIALILDAQEGRYELGKKLLKNMANNSSYSYKRLKNMGSKLAAHQFLSYWGNKWSSEIDLIFAKQLKQQMAIREYLQVASNTVIN